MNRVARVQRVPGMVPVHSQSDFFFGGGYIQSNSPLISIIDQAKHMLNINLRIALIVVMMQFHAFIDFRL